MAIQESLDAQKVAERFIARHNAALTALDEIEGDRAALAALTQAQRDALVVVINARYGAGVGEEITTKYGAWQRVRTAARTTEGLVPFTRSVG